MTPRLPARRQFTAGTLAAALSALALAAPGTADAAQAGASPSAAARSEPAPTAHQWTADEARTLVEALRSAQRHGLEAKAFLRQVENGRRDDEQLTQAALSYAGALAHGAADPAELHSIFTLRRNRVDVAAGLKTALDTGELGGWLDSLAPTDPDYRLLSAAYLRYREAARFPRPAAVDEDGVIRPGDADPRLPAIKDLLAWKGHAPRAGAGPAGRYHPALITAVERFQADEGLKVDGVLGPATLGALNSGPSDRARAIALNMERWRWLDRSPAPDRVDVNLAAARLDYYRHGALAWSTRTVVGRPDFATPALGETFSQVVVNPPWYVPSSIARREILPKGAAYLRRNDMFVRDGRVIQRPGPTAALGLVKFDMQNRHAIYLHDTPAKALFATDDRHRSHGCVRVQDAVAFARRLAEERGKGAEFDAALASGNTRTVQLGEPVAVRLLYRTAYVVNGRVMFAPDAYERDEALAEALGLGAVRRSKARPFAVIPLGP